MMFTQVRAIAIAMREPALLAFAGFMLMMSLAAIGATTSAVKTGVQTDAPVLALESDYE